MAATFSEAWYQVAPLKLALLPTVKVHKQVYRGETWYVLQDSCSDKFFRLRPKAYEFACQLSTRITVEQAWLDFVNRYPEDAPGQEDVIQLLGQLHHSNLLFYRSESDYDQIFKRFEKQRTKEHLTKLMAPLYLRIPIWNPNPFLNASRKLLLPLFSTFAFLIWLVVIFFGGKAAVENFDQLWVQGQGLLSLDNLLWLYASMFILKIFHEMGHAIVCKKYGGDVHTMGIMFIVFTPLPYMDASASWAMRNRWHRAMVGSAGMYVELFFAAVAAVIWANTAEGTLNSLAFNMMIIGSISSILFNGNPLLRFDAYYILSDIIDIPNLYQKANQQWQFYFDKFLLGTYKAEAPALSGSEGVWLTTYGFLSYIYRFLIMLIIMVYVTGIWIGLGIIMGIIMLFIWLIIPLKKLFTYLINSPKLQVNRTRAWVTSMSALALLFGAMATVPLPYSMKAPGVVLSSNSTIIYSENSGQLLDVAARSGDVVVEGQLLLRMQDDELMQDIAIVEAQKDETEWMLRQALQRSTGDLVALQTRMTFLDQRLAELQARADKLELRAPFDGVWVTQDLHERVGSFISRGDGLGQVSQPSKPRFVAVVTQEQVANLFREEFDAGTIRFRSRALEDLVVNELQFIPFQRQILPSPALGWDGGGPIMSRAMADGTIQAVEPFFEVHAVLPENYVAVEGQTGVLKIDLSWQPLYWQAKQFTLQLLQQRFKE